MVPDGIFLLWRKLLWQKIFKCEKKAIWIPLWLRVQNYKKKAMGKSFWYLKLSFVCHTNFCQNRKRPLCIIGIAYYAVHFCNGISLLQFTKKSSDKNVHWQFPILALVHSFRTLTDTSTWYFEITLQKIEPKTKYF